MAHIAVSSTRWVFFTSIFISPTIRVWGNYEQDRAPGEAFTPKAGKEIEMEKLMRSLNVSYLHL